MGSNVAKGAKPEAGRRQAGLLLRAVNGHSDCRSAGTGAMPSSTELDALRFDTERGQQSDSDRGAPGNNRQRQPIIAAEMHGEVGLDRRVRRARLPLLTTRLSCADRAASTFVRTVLSITATLATPIATKCAQRVNIRSRCCAPTLRAEEIVRPHPFPYFGIIEHRAWHANLQPYRTHLLRASAVPSGPRRLAVRLTRAGAASRRNRS